VVTIFWVELNFFWKVRRDTRNKQKKWRSKMAAQFVCLCVIIKADLIRVEQKVGDDAREWSKEKCLLKQVMMG